MELLVPLPPLFGCAHNEERNNYSTNRQTCAGELWFVKTVVLDQVCRLYICTKHLEEHTADGMEYFEIRKAKI